MKTIYPKDVRVRFLEDSDIADLVGYFYDSPDGFIEGIGINIKTLGSRQEFTQRYNERLKEIRSIGKQPHAITVFYQGQKVGIHSATHLIENKSLVMHAHFFDPKFRGLGIGQVSSIKAAELFMEEFNLKEVLAKVPLKNVAPLKLMEKLGLPAAGTEIIDWPLLTGPMEAKVFRATAEDLQRLKKIFGI